MISCFIGGFDWLLGNPQVLCKALSRIQECGGDPSLQNSLQMAMRGLQ